MTEPLDIAAVYLEHGPFLARSLERLAGPGAPVDDLLQETFIVAFKKRGEFDATRAAVSTWLYGIAANLCFRHRRSQRRWGLFRDKLERTHVEPAATLPDAAVERDEALQLVAEALAAMPQKQREVFALYELEELDGAAIAELVGIPEGTVWTRLHHARKAFTKSMRRRLQPKVLS